jgi:hypothetical protein
MARGAELRFLRRLAFTIIAMSFIHRHGFCYHNSYRNLAIGIIGNTFEIGPTYSIIIQ